MTEKLLNENIVEQVRDVFAELKQPVQILFFGKKSGCDTCETTLQLAQEVSDLSQMIELQTYDLDEDAATAQAYGIDKAPGLVIAAKDGDEIHDLGVRYSGIPAGHEFSSFIHSMLLVSGRESGLNQETRDFLAKLTQPVHLQVFVTPT